jgi:hypothetical protein
MTMPTSTAARPFAALGVLACLLWGSAGRAAPVAVANAGFEDTTGQTVFNEFTFGEPAGWSYYPTPPAGIIGSSGVFTGTLEPNGVDFFDTTAPEGVKVAILFNDSREGEGEYGYVQTLGVNLEADVLYELQVEVGNIGSGVASNGTPFNLDEFPGYRVELLAGGVMIAEDDDTLAIPEYEWATSTVNFLTDAGHPQLGQPLAIRLVNQNVIPPGYTQGDSPDLEVDFDDVALEATPVPEPAAMLPIGAGLVAALHRYRRRSG